MILSLVNLRNGFIGLGISILLATGIVSYFNKQTNYLTWEQYQEVLISYNAKIEEIKKDCYNDVRCIEQDGKPKVILRNIKNNKDIPKQINEWIEEDYENPNTYKLK